MKKVPRSYQQTAFERFKDAVWFCLNFACGLGKTFVFAMIAKHSKMPTIIIAPKRLCKQWEQELIEEGFAEPEDIFLCNKPLETKDPQKYYERYNAFLRS